MSTTWFYLVENRAVGPYSTAEIQKLLRAEMIGPSTLLSMGGSGNWVPASSVSGLMPAAPASPPLATQQPYQASGAGQSLQSRGLDVAAAAPSFTQQKSPFANPLVIGAIGLALMGLVAFGAWQMGRTTAPAVGEKKSSDSSKPSKGTKKSKDEDEGDAEGASEDTEVVSTKRKSKDDEPKLSREIEDLKKQRRALQSEVQTLDDKKAELDRKTRELEKKVKELTTLLENRKRWSEPQFVFVNPDHVAVGVVLLPDGSVKFQHKDEDLAARLAITTARESKIPRVACDKKLTHRLFQDFKKDEKVSNELMDEVRKILSPKKYLPVDLPIDQALTFVTFKNATKNEQVLGILKEIKSDHLVYTNFSKQDLNIAKSDLRPGSARVAQGQEIISSLKAGDFLDYCLYNVAHKLAASKYVAIAVRVGVDEMPAEPQPSPRRAPLQVATNSPAAMATGILLNEFLNHIYEPRNPHASVKLAAQYVEDEVYSKLVKLGVRIVETEQLDTVRQMQLTNVVDDVNRLNLTHALLVEVKAPQRKGEYHLSVRLVDAVNNEVICAESGDRVRGFDESEHVFHLGSGKIAAIETDNGKVPADFKGLEQPPVVPVNRRPSAKLSRNLVYLESETPSTVKYRNLFDLKLQELPRKDKDKQDAIKSIVEITKPSEVPREMILRYVVCRLARSCQQIAGRVLEVQGQSGSQNISNRTAKVSLASADGIKPGDVLEVLRIHNLPDGGRSQEILATQLTVTQVFDDHSLARILPTGLESEWPEVGELRAEDVVLPAVSPRRTVALVNPHFKMPSNRSPIGMTMSNPVTATRIKMTTGHVAETVNTILSKSFTTLGIAVALDAVAKEDRRTRVGFRIVEVPETPSQVLKRLKSQGVTHAVVWDIQPLDEVKYKITMAVYPFTNNDEVPKPIDLFDFEVPESQLK